MELDAGEERAAGFHGAGLCAAGRESRWRKQHSLRRYAGAARASSSWAAGCATVCAVPFSRHLRAYSIALGKAKAAALCLCACALSVALPLAIGEGAWLLMALITPLCTVSMALLRSKVPFPELANRDSDIMSAARAEAESIGSVCAATGARRAKGRRL